MGSSVLSFRQSRRRLKFLLTSLRQFSIFLHLVSLSLRLNSVPSLFLSRLMSCHRPLKSISSSLCPIARRRSLESSTFSFLKSCSVEVLCFSARSSMSSLEVLSFWGLLIQEYPPRPLVGSAKPLISILLVRILNLRKDSERYQLVSWSCSRIIRAIVIFSWFMKCFLLNSFKTFFIFSLVLMSVMPTYRSQHRLRCMRQQRQTYSGVRSFQLMRGSSPARRYNLESFDVVFEFLRARRKEFSVSPLKASFNWSKFTLPYSRTCLTIKAFSQAPLNQVWFLEPGQKTFLWGYTCPLTYRLYILRKTHLLPSLTSRNSLGFGFFLTIGTLARLLSIRVTPGPSGTPISLLLYLGSQKNCLPFSPKVSLMHFLQRSQCFSKLRAWAVLRTSLYSSIYSKLLFWRASALTFSKSYRQFTCTIIRSHMPTSDRRSGLSSIYSIMMNSPLTKDRSSLRLNLSLLSLISEFMTKPLGFGRLVFCGASYTLTRPGARCQWKLKLNLCSMLKHSSSKVNLTKSNLVATSLCFSGQRQTFFIYVQMTFQMVRCYYSLPSAQCAQLSIAETSLLLPPLPDSPERRETSSLLPLLASANFCRYS